MRYANFANWCGRQKQEDDKREAQRGLRASIHSESENTAIELGAAFGRLSFRSGQRQFRNCRINISAEKNVSGIECRQRELVEVSQRQLAPPFPHSSLKLKPISKAGFLRCVVWVTPA